MQTVADALLFMAKHPGEVMFRRWNYKAALFSALWRGGIFFFSTLSSGWKAAAGALVAEFAFRSATAGFYGSFIQQMNRARPEWLASALVLIGLPIVAHTLEFAMHKLRGTPNLGRSIGISIMFTVLSTFFNMYAMRRGVLLVGDEGKTIGSDLRRMPRVIGSFLMLFPVSLYRLIKTRRQT